MTLDLSPENPEAFDPVKFFKVSDEVIDKIVKIQYEEVKQGAFFPYALKQVLLKVWEAFEDDPLRDNYMIATSFIMGRMARRFYLSL